MRETTRFVAACSRWPQDAAAQEAVRGAAARVTDWQEVREEVRRHRVVALVQVAIRDVGEVPEAFVDWVAQAALRQGHHAMQLTHECVVVDRALKAAGTQPLHVKGPVLGEMVFGSVARKYSRDLDIFVSAQDAPTAIATLQDMGYRKVGHDAPVMPEQATAVIRHCKDLALIGPPGNLIELHWRLSHTRTLLTFLEDAPKRQEVRVASAARLETFTNDQMVAYLCVHGSLHHWMRLKWLAELSAFLNQLPPEERDQILADLSQSPQADATALTLALCDTYLGTDYTPSLSRRARKLYRYAVARIDRPIVPAKSILGDWRLTLDMLATRHLYTSPLVGIWAMRAHLIGQDDVMAWPLPRYLKGVYILIRLPSLLVRRLRTRAWARPRKV